MNRYRLLSLTGIVLMTYSTFVCAGIGGVIGGNGIINTDPKWIKLVNSRSHHIAWPLVKFSNKQSYRVGLLCRDKENNLRTAIKFAPGILDRDKGIESTFAQRRGRKWDRRHLERVFDESNCVTSIYPNCNLVGQYVEDTVYVPVYKLPLSFFDKGGKSSGDKPVDSFAHRKPNGSVYANFRDTMVMEKFKIPRCK